MEQEQLLCIGFNTDISCFTVGTDNGFRVFNTIPVELCIKRDFPGGLGIVELLNRSNLLVLVGGGYSPRYPCNKIIFWDERIQSQRGELTMKGEIKSAKLCNEFCIVAIESRIYIYRIRQIELLDTIDTSLNTKGVMSVIFTNSLIVAAPDVKRGYVVIKNIHEDQVKIFRAHKTQIAVLSINKDASLIATASDKGTMVRLFDFNTLQMLKELRRGIDRADIFSISFSINSDWLACSSDKGTVHIFSLNQQNPKSMFRVLGKYFRYFHSEWSFAQMRIQDVKAICVFGLDNSIIVLDSNGIYYRGKFNANTGGDCELLERHSIFEFN